jgi:aminoglycoside 3-N-acetyltransferase
VLGADGAEVRAVECLDDSDGIVEYPGEDYFGVIVRQYLASGAGTRGQVGRAASELVDAKRPVNFAVEWMKTHLTRSAG